MKKDSIKAFSFLFSLGMIIMTYTSCIKMNNDVPLIPKTVLFGNAHKTYPALSPDGKKLAYCAPLNGVLNIWVKTVDKNDDNVLTHETKRGIAMFHWAANSKQLFYIRDNNGDENYQLYAVDCVTGEIKNYTLFAGVKAKILKIDKDYPDEILLEMNKENPKLFDVYHLDLVTEKLTLVAKNPGNVTHWVVGQQLQVLGSLETNKDGSQDVFVRNNNEDSWKKLLSVTFEDTLVDELYSGLLGFSKDDAYMFLNTSLGQNTRCLQKVNVMTGEREILAQDPEFDVAYVTFNTLSQEPEIVCWNKERYEYAVLNPDFNNDFERIKTLSNGDLHAIRKTNDGKKILLGFMTDVRSVEYYFYDVVTKESSMLFLRNPELSNYQLAPMEPISFRARDGLKIYGYLTCPLNTRKENLPLVLLVHGGPFARDSWGYDPVVQLLANRGCACLQINYRGSSGYGKNFLSAGNLEWGAKMQDDLVDGVQWAVDRGIADPKRIAIFGGSYGGYAALMGATTTPELFRCAISLCGPSNLITVLQTLPPYWSLSQWEQRIGKLSDEEFLKSRSPLFYLDKIKIPLLIVHGANDVRVKQSESEQIVKALQEKNIPHDYLLFNDEGHGLVRPENRLKFYAQVEQFLAQHLGTRAE